VTNSAKSTSQRESDAALLRLAREGNEEAFATLFNANKAKVYSLCLRMTSNTAEAEDLTQDAFFQVFRKLGSFRGDSALSTWLYRVAVNTVLMHFRKKGVRHLSLDEPVTREPGAAKREYGTVDERLTKSVDRIALSRAMRELPEGYRKIFLMHEIKGYDHREIANLLSCSVGNSKSQLHRAKAKMRELMGSKRKEEANRAVPEIASEMAPEMSMDQSWEASQAVA